jgi:hypothetical protein
MAIITAKAVTGNFSVGTNWVGDVAPTTGDTVVIPSGATITVAADTPVLGSNASAVGHGVTVQSGGTLLVGATLNANGYDRVSNRAVQVEAGGIIQRGTGGKIVVTPVSTWQTIINNDGDFIWDGGEIESGEPWTFAEVGQTLSVYAPSRHSVLAGVGSVFMVPIGTTANTSVFVSQGPVSSAAGTAVGTPTDNSFSITSQSRPTHGITTQVASFEALSALGDYYVDCPNSMLYYVSDDNRTTFTYTCKTHKWHGFGIQSARNGDSKFKVENTTFRRLGGNFGSHNSETVNASERAIFMDRRTNGVVNAAREGYVRNCTFEYCIAPLQAYNSTNTESNPLDLSGNTYKYVPFVQGNMGSTIFPGYSSHIKCDDSTFDMIAKIASWWGRGVVGATMRRLTGKACCDSILGNGAVGSIAEDCVLMDTGALADAGGFQYRGNTASGPNIYRRNKLTHGHRCGRIGSYMTIENNEFVQFQHHGFVKPAVNGFFTNIKIKANITRDVVKSGRYGRRLDAWIQLHAMD